jgi:hypothetical protein
MISQIEARLEDVVCCGKWVDIFSRLNYREDHKR